MSQTSPSPPWGLYISPWVQSYDLKTTNNMLTIPILYSHLWCHLQNLHRWPWCRPGDKPLSEPIVVSLQTHICVTRHQWINSTRIWLIPAFHSPTRLLVPWALQLATFLSSLVANHKKKRGNLNQYTKYFFKKMHQKMLLEKFCPGSMD